MKRLHTLMLFLAVLFTGFNVEAASVKQALSCDPNAGLNNLERVQQRMRIFMKGDHSITSIEIG